MQKRTSSPFGVIGHSSWPSVPTHSFSGRFAYIGFNEARNVYFSPTCMHSLFLFILMTELNHNTTLHLFAAKAFITTIACGYKWELRACFDAANQPSKQRTQNKQEERRSVLMNFLGLYWTKPCRLNEGIFVHLCPKNACARHVGSLPSHQTEQLDGRGWIANFCNFLGCN